ncbi:MAG: thioredoxin [Nanoarchaeota archaeon]
MDNQNEMANELSEEEFNEVIRNGHTLVIVDFFAEWCMPCLMLAPLLEELAEKFKNVKFAKVNVDDNRKLSVKYEVSSIPCLVFFKDGKEIDRMIGLRETDEIEEKIKNNLR